MHVKALVIGGTRCVSLGSGFAVLKLISTITNVQEHAHIQIPKAHTFSHKFSIQKQQSASFMGIARTGSYLLVLQASAAHLPTICFKNFGTEQENNGFVGITRVGSYLRVLDNFLRASVVRLSTSHFTVFEKQQCLFFIVGLIQENGCIAFIWGQNRNALVFPKRLDRKAGRSTMNSVEGTNQAFHS